MKSPLRVLLLEDNPVDADLTLAMLAADGIDCEPVRIDTRTDFIRAIEQHSFDLILSDNALPAFDGLSALAIACEKSPDTPFILVSGTLGEEVAIETLKSGATDYVLKHRLARLAPAVRRAISEFEERTARQHAERAWREADALFRSVFHSTSVGIAVFDLEQRIIQTNRALQDMFGYNAEELNSMTLAALTQPDETPLDDKLLSDLAAGRRASHEAEQRYRQKDGTTLWGRLTLSPILREDDRPAYVALIENITERKALEQQLIASQKMEAVGRLAAGIAHDFNNVLTVITGYTSLLLARTPPDGVLHKEISEIGDASQRATALTKRLLSFSRQQVEEPRVLDLNAIITGIDPMLRRVIGEHLRLTTQVAPQPACVTADQVHLEQILMNLVINARDAIGAGGAITIATNHEEINEERAATLGISAGAYIMLAVKDTGHGMDDATKARIFEPFFTTKEIGKGTGLGLWTVREIVLQSKGTIVVDSQPGQGTTFTIWLPRAHGHADATPVLATSTSHTGTETILVVDDNEDLRELMHEVLNPAGYRTLMAATGNDALQLAASQHIDLLITDLLMPAMLGTDVAKRVTALRPEAKVLYVSGYDQPTVENQSLPGRAYLQKPFTSDMLLQRVREILEMPRQATIVIADDDPGIRKLLRDILRPSGYRILEAADGKQAVEHLVGERVDLLLTDLLMPEQEGIETIRAVKKRFPHLRIIAMSGGFGAQFLNIARTMGADHIMRKPFETDAIRDAIRRLLAQQPEQTAYRRNH